MTDDGTKNAEDKQKTSKNFPVITSDRFRFIFSEDYSTIREKKKCFIDLKMKELQSYPHLSIKNILLTFI